jgi:hypothetical protein
MPRTKATRTLHFDGAVECVDVVRGSGEGNEALLRWQRAE